MPSVTSQVFAGVKRFLKEKKIPDDTRTNGLNATNKIEERVSSIKYIKYHTKYTEHVLHHQRLFGRNVVIINKSDNI